MIVRFALLSLVAATLHLAAAPAAAGPKVTVGRLHPVASRLPMKRVSHQPWNALLAKYVDDAGRVDYRGWKQSAADVAALDRYLASLSQADRRISGNRSAELAFWINAYNAVTIKGILREYPTSSIRNHTAKLYGYNIWHDLLLLVGDEKISLNDIEHEVLRKMNEPRVHFAIVCASHSCPRLLNQAYAAESLERQLAANTRQFFANRENFRHESGTFYLSSILKWFAEDFGADRAAQLKAIGPYLPDRGSQQAAAGGNVRVSYLPYDWSLNERPARSARR